MLSTAWESERRDPAQSDCMAILQARYRARFERCIEGWLARVMVVARLATGGRDGCGLGAYAGDDMGGMRKLLGCAGVRHDLLFAHAQQRASLEQPGGSRRWHQGAAGGRPTEDAGGTAEPLDGKERCTGHSTAARVQHLGRRQISTRRPVHRPIWASRDAGEYQDGWTKASDTAGATGAARLRSAAGADRSRQPRGSLQGGGRLPLI